MGGKGGPGMETRRLIAGLVGTLMLIAACSALAGSNPDVKVAVHAMYQEARTCSENFPVISGCEDITPMGGGLDHNPDIFPVFFDIVEYRKLEYAFTFPFGIDVSFTSCSDQAIIDGSTYYWEITQTYDECQPGPTAVPGWFVLVYEAGPACIVGHPTTGLISIGDCHEPMGMDYAPCGFCGSTGHPPQACDPCAPCEPSAADESSWGKVKTLFR
jgi:hypothetical protein